MAICPEKPVEAGSVQLHLVNDVPMGKKGYVMVRKVYQLHIQIESLKTQGPYQSLSAHATEFCGGVVKATFISPGSAD